ncbi:MAG TPA: M48 family metallopeptidase [Thiobacillaceae bacterium]|nr:M48 family metallopeptidase [Thiobacillaceae bacterium]HNU64795.1 M48 family metallopeptidase [Thiobacillaceae bacterium]
MKRLLPCALLVLAGCSANPMTGRSQLSLVSETSVINQARSAYAEELAPWNRQGKVNNDRALKARVDAITQRLVAQAVRYRPDAAKWEWQVAVIDAPDTLNAYCLPGGRMAIYSGLVRQLKATDAEIAQVMGHEIGHALANHGAEKMSQAMAAEGVVLVAATAAGRKHQDTVLTGGTAIAQLGWLLPNSRGAESEADRIGIEIAARAGYDPNAAVSLWRKMNAAQGRGVPPLLSTHPAPEARMRDLAALVPHMQPLYAQALRGPLPTATLADGAQGTAAGGATSSRPLTLVPIPTRDERKP